MEFFNLIKATQKSGKPDGVIWHTAKSESRANLQLDVDLEDADIETGRGHDYMKPIRTDFPVFNDLPAEGVYFTRKKRRLTMRLSSSMVSIQRPVKLLAFSPAMTIPISLKMTITTPTILWRSSACRSASFHSSSAML